MTGEDAIMKNRGKYKWLALITMTALLLTACGGQNRAASMHLSHHCLDYTDAILDYVSPETSAFGM